MRVSERPAAEALGCLEASSVELSSSPLSCPLKLTGTRDAESEFLHGLKKDQIKHRHKM